MTQKELIEKTLVLQDAVTAYKTILETIEYHLNELLLDMNNQSLNLNEPINTKTSNNQRYRDPNRDPI